MSNDNAFTPNKDPQTRLPASHSFVNKAHKQDIGNDEFDDDDLDQLREVEDELEDETFEVHQVTTQAVPASKTLGAKRDPKAAASRFGLKQPTAIGAGTSGIGSGIGGGLRKPTNVKPTTGTNTASNFASQNGISGSKIQNNFNAAISSKDPGATPSLMGKFGDKKPGAKQESKLQGPRATAQADVPSRLSIGGTATTGISSFGNKTKQSNLARPQTATTQLTSSSTYQPPSTVK